MNKVYQKIIAAKPRTHDELSQIKRQMCKKYGLESVKNTDILKYYQNEVKSSRKKANEKLEQLLRKRSVRTMSGIAPVAVLTRPYSCPGKCAFCPTEKNVPQSYLSNEPAVMRAIRCHYDPYIQVQLRLRALENNGHHPTKIELIVIGGTWSVLPEKYKYWFMERCFAAANEFGKMKMELVNRKQELGKQSSFPITNYQFPIPKNKISTIKLELQTQQNKNESAKYQLIGVTLETRPDYINENELIQMRELGCTRVELGVQAVDDAILKLNKRGHGVDAIAQATAMLRDFGFKITYHLMPGLPGATIAKDIMLFGRLFTDERFQPDQIKFYPTIVTKGSLMYKWWQTGKYRPYTTRQLVGLIAKCKSLVPRHVRIIRLIRDIPGESIIAGNLVTNLRQMLQQQGVKCNCIRCREAKRESRIKNYELRIKEYQAASGVEYFIEMTDKSGEVLFGFCRLRLSSHNAQRITHNVKALQDAAIIRELHVYGELNPVGSGKKKVQHSGLGKKLMLTAENLARKNGFRKIAVIAGVGVRGYYRKLGYRLQSSYMVKLLKH